MCVTSTGGALESSEAESHPARLVWEWLWSTPRPEIPERPLPAGWAKLRLRRVARWRACATPPRFHRQSGSLGTDEAQPHRNPESARDSKSDHDSCGRQKPEVPIRNRTGRPPGRSSGLNFSHRTRRRVVGHRVDAREPTAAAVVLGERTRASGRNLRHRRPQLERSRSP